MIIGIDAGTSFVKAVALSEGGETLAVEGRRTKLYNPMPDHFEQDLEEIVAAVGEVVTSVSERAGEAPEMLGITGQGDGLWLLDEWGRSVRPCITWLDARANSIVEEWMASGVFEAVFRRNGNIVFPGAPAPLMAALSRSEPGSLKRAATAGYCKDAILQRLTGERATDASDASEPFLDPRTRCYDPELLRLFGLEAYGHLLAPIDPAPGTMHPLNAEGAELTSLPEGTPVHNGPFDVPATAMGAGVRKLGEGLIIIGTTLACEVLVDHVDTCFERGGQTLCTLEPDRWLRAMAAMVGTASLDLMLSLIGATHADVDGFLAESPPGAQGASVLPFFSPSGERAPFVNPRARGQVAGMDLNTTRADVVRAVCESVGYAARHCMESAGLDGDVAICGGGAQSSAWCQILADILQRPLRRARPEVGARGAAMAAMISSDRDFDHAQWTRPGGYVEPRPEVAGLYKEGFTYYLNSIEAARALWGSAPQTKVPT
jgi:sugar (pentulose or hexulose) kinase